MKSSWQARNDAGQESNRSASTASGLPIPGASPCDHRIYQVVQNHRQLRSIAPAIASAETTALTLASQLNWTAATQAVFAAWLPLSFTRNGVVASAGKSGTRVSQTARTSLGRKSRFFMNSRRFEAARGKAYQVGLIELSGTGKHIISYRPAPQERARADDATMA